MTDIKGKSSNEEEYFRKQEQERLAAKRVEAATAKAKADREALKQLHFMHCPKCGATLEPLTYLKVTIDRCPECQGVWLDHGEGRAILAAEAKSGKGFFTDFIRGVTGGKKEESPL
jgi:predicted Zn-ribbon and HTH transcriptional regulator